MADIQTWEESRDRPTHYYQNVAGADHPRINIHCTSGVLVATYHGERCVCVTPSGEEISWDECRRRATALGKAFWAGQPPGTTIKDIGGVRP